MPQPTVTILKSDPAANLVTSIDFIKAIPPSPYFGKEPTSSANLGDFFEVFSKRPIQLLVQGECIVVASARGGNRFRLANGFNRYVASFGDVFEFAGADRGQQRDAKGGAFVGFH